MRVPVSWLREFADVPADPKAVAAKLALCGFSVEGIEGDVIDFEVTANRPDCLSIIGFAREARTAFNAGSTGSTGSAGTTGLPAEAAAAKAGAAHAVPVHIESEACGRYVLALADVTVGSSPQWLSDRLTAAGIRPVNNVVDVSNYVMLEMGQPTHAFDLARLSGPAIHVRMARAGERLTTLDGETRTLDPSMLVIADRDRPVAVAGVMGGRASEVSASTTRIALESAWFRPGAVRSASRRLSLKTEASARFERGADPEAPLRAAERVLSLLEQIGAGRRAGVMTDVHPNRPSPRHVELTRQRLARLLGTTVPDADVTRILTSLGFTLSPASGGWRAAVPTYRVDVAREADLIEEVGRHWGFDRIPATVPPLRSAPPAEASHAVAGRQVRGLLTGAGLQEASTFTFIERSAAEPFAEADDLVPIANPLSEKFAVLRPSLLPGLVEALVYNRRREAETVWLFEVGNVFTRAGESSRVGWVMTGPRQADWSGTSAPADFFDAKGVAEQLAEAFGLDVTAEPAADLPGLVPGRAARLVVAGPNRTHVVGHVGQIRPDVVAARGLDTGVVVGGEFFGARGADEGGWSRDARLKPLPRFPSAVRDLSILVDERLPAAAVRGTIHANAPASLEMSVREFDRYQGKGIPAGQVSLSVRLTFRHPDRTLTDGEVQRAVESIVAALAREHRAALRGT